MQTLLSVYRDYDRGHLRIIAELCGIRLSELSEASMAQDLAERMLSQDTLQEILDGLRPEIRNALKAIQIAGGKITTTEMDRRFGSIRRMGAGRRDHEKPWREPVSSHEHLWYAGLIAHAFADSPRGPREFTFIPTDLLRMLPETQPDAGTALGKPASVPENTRQAGAFILDDATTILAALRRRPAEKLALSPNRQAKLARYLHQPESLRMVTTLLSEDDLLGASPVMPKADQTRAFLEADRGAALLRFFDTWRESQLWNDLANTPGILAAGADWPNDPCFGRQAFLRFLAEIPIGSWWSLDQFRIEIFQNRPDFQRPTGEFDSWYLQHSESGATLRGIADWELVDGALITYYITGPLHWLGITDLGFASDGERCSCFRLTQWADAIRNPEPSLNLPGWDSKCQVKPTGMIVVPRKCSHLFRYQVARFAAWGDLENGNYHFQLTPDSLAEAEANGLQIHHILKILNKASEGALPSSIRLALESWHKHGSSGQIERVFILRVSAPEILATLRKEKSTARHLGEGLGPDTVLVPEKAWRPLFESALKLGIWIGLPAEAGEESP